MPANARGAGSRAACALGGLLGVLVGAAPGIGQEPGTDAEKPQVNLQRLLELPSDLEYGAEKKGGLTRGEWRVRFQELRLRLAAEEKQLEQAKQERADVSSSADAWKLGLPGGIGATTEAPLDYQVSQRIKRHKAEVDRLERALLDLEVEANLAGVPASWRE